MTVVQRDKAMYENRLRTGQSTGSAPFNRKEVVL